MRFKISIKTKSLVFVLGLISILFFLFYYQNSLAYKTYLAQIERTYSKSFDNYFNDFLKNTLKYYELPLSYFIKLDVVKALRDNDNKTILESMNFIFDGLKNNNKFLKQISFVDINFKYKIDKNRINFEPNLKQTYEIYKSKINFKQKSLSDIVNIDDKIYFRFVFGIYFDNELLGFIEALVDSKILFKNLNQFDTSLGFIIQKNQNFIMLDNTKLKLNNLNKDSALEINNKFFVSKIFDLKNIQGQKIAQSVFLLDVTSKNIFYQNEIKQMFLFTLVLFIIISIVLNQIFTYLITKLELSNITLQRKIKQAIKKEREAIYEKQEKQRLLITQSRLAQTGEMIGNIAHQWRQPLMQLSSIFMFLEAYLDKNKIDKKLFFTKFDEANETIEFMSKTIDDFRNFYRYDKKQEIFKLKDAINKSISIINSSLQYHKINLSFISEDDSINTLGYKNEFSQALLNIISNSKDALLQTNTLEPKIKIELFKNKDYANILIQDNAGGIKKDIIEKIFDPYFTTKHAYQGTGIGLYMTKIIIEKNMQGKISVLNKIIANETWTSFLIEVKIHENL